MISPRSLATALGGWRRRRRRPGDAEIRGYFAPEAAVAGRGRFVVYTSDRRRHELPLGYLNTSIFRELLRVSEEEYGLPGDGRIVLACDGAFVDYVQRLLRGRVSKDVERAVVQSIAAGCCTEQRPDCGGRRRPQAAVVCGF